MKKIDESWRNYSARLILIGMTPDALVVARRMFYSGAIALLNILTSGEPEDGEEMVDVSNTIAELKDELNTFSEEDQKVHLYKPNKKLYKMH